MEFEDLCGSEFLDQNMYWNTTNPDVPECFQLTIFPIVLFAYTMVFCVPYILCIRRRESHHTRPQWLCTVKKTLSIALLVINIGELLGLLIRQHVMKVATPPMYLFVPGVQGFLMAVMIVLAHYEHIKDTKNSGYYFGFWFLFTGIIVVRFRSAVLTFFTEAPEDFFRFIPVTMYLPLVVAQLVFSCITLPREHSDDMPCPEKYSSFLSRILFWWFNRLMIQGYRKTLTLSDLWSLNESDKSRCLVPKFLQKLHKFLPDVSKKDSEATGSAENGVVDEMKMQTFSWKGEPNSKDQNGETNVDQVGDQEDDTLLVTVKQPKPDLSFSTKHCVSLSIVQAFWPLFLTAFICKLINDTLMFINPQLLKWLIQFVEDTSQPGWRGYFIAALMLSCAIFQTLILHQYFHNMAVAGMRIKSSLISTIYRKAIRLSNSARKTSTMGEIVNLMSVDCQKLQELMLYVHTVWSSPYQIFLSIYFLYRELGPSIFAGVTIMILVMPMNAVFAVFLKRLQMALMKQKDSRIKLMNEILNGVKVLKLYAWEKIFGNKVLDIRDKELHIMRNSACLNALSSLTWNLSPFMVALTTFAVYIFSSTENVLTSEKAFVSLTLFNLLRFPLVMLPNVISQLIQASVSLRRITDYLLNDEIDPSNVSQEETPGVAAVIVNGSFTWDRSTKVQPLKKLTIHFRENSLVAVVGPVGSGKSSLLSALLGEMDKVSGRVNVRGSVAYVSQVAWIQNATVRDNITFGKAFDQELYDRVLSACALRRDLQILPDGDSTEIGEKGINLSGGQKQRISLARACYAQTDIYLLDDPLSAVDAHVGKHIFEHVIGPTGLLSGRTRVLVTHAVTVLPHCDNIIVLGETGSVKEMGSYSELIRHAGPFANFIATHLNNSSKVDSDDEIVATDTELLDDLEVILDDLQVVVDCEAAKGKEVPLKRLLSASRENLSRSKQSLNEKSQSPTETPQKSPKKMKEAAQKLIQEEKAEEGQVKMSVFFLYMKAIGLPLSIFIVFVYILFYGIELGSKIWLARWSEDSGKPNVTVDNVTLPYAEYMRDYRLTGYGLFGLGQAVAQFCLTIGWALALLRTARGLHSEMLNTVIRCPMSFFDTTPLGRIMNRFSKDIDTVDTILISICTMFLMCFFNIISTTVALILPSAWIILPLIPIFVCYGLMQRVYVATARQLKRLESVTRSPIYSHFSESLQGVSTIRAFGFSNRFIEQSEDLVDINLKTYYPTVSSNRWLAVRLETIGSMMVFLSSIFAVISRNSGEVVTGLTGLAVSSALGVTQTLNWMVRMASELEANIVSVERIKEYSELPTEAATVVDDARPPPGWPKGSIQFEDYSCRYRPGLDLVLRHISYEVRAGEKVGIVGRTGAGKSSMVSALFRIVEPAGGRMLVDGVDVSGMGLHDLRSRLTTIPQDPVLFSGSLRLNLDPGAEADDDAVWSALEDANLAQLVRENESGLEMEVSEGGENFSVGQRQLVCLARALLRRTRILVLDEATSAVDLDTDALIQRTIREKFADATILTIAHRLHTILDYDRILVLQEGSIQEFAPPSELLADPNSAFYQMAKDAGLVAE